MDGSAGGSAGGIRHASLFMKAQALIWRNPHTRLVFGWLKVQGAAEGADEGFLPASADEGSIAVCESALAEFLGPDALCERLWGGNIGFFADPDGFSPSDLLRTLQDALVRFSGRRSLPEEGRVRLNLGLCETEGFETVDERLLAFAGLAMFSAPAICGSSFHWYSESLFENADSRQMLERYVLRALDRKQFSIRLQPVCDSTQDGRVVAAEALVRWTYPGFGEMSPALFLPLVEKLGLMRNLDLFVLDEVCLFQKKRISADAPLVPIAVNLARSDLLSDIDFSSRAMAIVDGHALDHSLVQFELLEGSLSPGGGQGHLIAVASQIAFLRDCGFKISIDDYGAGASNIETLCSVPFDVLKLDKSLIDRCHDDTVACVLRYILQCMDELGKEVVAEGVETRDQLMRLSDMGCSYVQGYLFSKPLRIADFAKLLDSGGIEPAGLED
jgi:EAL domain-containing protein (putative c-di-GMP-specific phosphodiesterase class I)